MCLALFLADREVALVAVPQESERLVGQSVAIVLDVAHRQTQQGD